MHPALAAALLALAAGQVVPVPEEAEEPAPASLEAPAPVAEEPTFPAEPEPGAEVPLSLSPATLLDPVGLSSVLGRGEELEDEDLRRSRIPFLPSAAAPVRNRVGTHLAAGALGQLRTRNLSGGGLTQWDTDLEVVPGLALFAFGHKAQFTLSYAPRLYFPAVWHGGPMSVLQRARARLDWAPSSSWALAAWGNGTYGDYSQLVPSSTPGGPGPSPPVLDPVRSYSTYPYLAVDVNASAAFSFRRGARLRAAAGWFDVGGLGTAGQQSQPRTWGPRGDLALDVGVGTSAALTTTLAAIDSQLVGGGAVRLAAGTETWTQRWSAGLDTSVSLGAALVNNPPAAAVTVGHVIPVAGIRLTWVHSSRDMVRVIADLGLGPYVDTYLQAAYQRLTGRVGAEWFIGRRWKLEASLAAALTPFTIRQAESYTVAGASAVWTPVRWCSLLAGGFAQTQLTGPSANRFVQLTGYLSASFQSPDFP